MPGTVLVTGGFGLVGSQTVRRLSVLGRTVVIADLDTPANLKAAEKLPPGVTVQWADLTDAEQTSRLVSEVAPAAIIHLAAVIPPGDLPQCQSRPARQRRCHGHIGRHRRGPAHSPAIRPGLQQRGVRLAQPAQSTGPVTADMPMKRSRSLQRTQSGRRGDRSRLLAGVGGAPTRRSAERGSEGDPVQRRRHLLREPAAHRLPHAQRRRP